MCQIFASNNVLSSKKVMKWKNNEKFKWKYFFGRKSYIAKSVKNDVDPFFFFKLEVRHPNQCRNH